MPLFAPLAYQQLSFLWSLQRSEDFGAEGEAWAAGGWVLPRSSLGF